MLRRIAPLALAALALAVAAPRARAEGEIRTPTGGRLALVEHLVRVDIVDQVAITRVTQVFRNDTGAAVEGIYGFPLPDGAQLTAFRATVGGKLREGKMYEQAQARAAYEAARAAGHDAALAETGADSRYTVALARIDAGATPRVELEYLQLLTHDTGMVAYTYPLAGRGRAAQAAGRFDFRCEVASLVPITIAYSNSHRLAVERTADRAVATFSATDHTPDADLHFAYHVKRDQTGIDVRLHRPAGSPFGYACIAITPRADLLPEDILARDLTFVVDVSGSMRGQKIEQARRALAYCLRTLRPRDRFNVVTFSYGAQRLWDGLRHASRVAVDEGLALATGLVADGGTNIGAALTAALADGTDEARRDGRPHLIVFLTDGRPTQGETRTAALVDACTAGLRDNTRIFTFGIGHDLDRFLLRTVAHRSRGTAAFVERDHELELAVSTFQQRIANPVLADLVLTAEGATLEQAYPRNVAFLFHGDQLLVCARYTGSGPGAIQLTGRAAGEQVTFRVPVDFPAEEAGGAVLSRLWAQKKMQTLLDELQLRGDEPELRQEVIALSLEHGVASPYTSFLVLDPDAAVATPAAEADDELKKGEESLRRVADLKSKSRGAAPQDAGAATGGLAAPGAAADPAKPAAPAPSQGGGAVPPAASPTTPTAPSGPAGPGAPARPQADAGRWGGRARRDAPAEPAPDARAEKLDAERDAGPPGARAARAWLATKLAGAELAPRERALVALALHAGGECRAFGEHAELLARACDALDAAKLANETLDTWLVVALLRVESYRLSGERAEKQAAVALLEGAATRAAAAMATATADQILWASLVVRQAAAAKLAVPAGLEVVGRQSEVTPEGASSASQSLARAVAAAGTGVPDPGASTRWAAQQADGRVDAPTGAAAETALRLLADQAAYWLGQVPR